MALTALEIFKLLPKTNCKDCGRPTCLAFAMQLAQKKAQLSDCPHISEEAKTTLEGASAPPINLVTIGVGERALSIGEENVLFRHEEKFYNPAGIAVALRDELSAEDRKSRLDAINGLKFERVGQEIAIDLVAVVESGNGHFAETCKFVAENSSLHLLLVSGSAEKMKEAASAVAERRPLLHAATPDNWEAMAAVAKELKVPLAVRAGGLEPLAELTPKLQQAGAEDLVLDGTGSSMKESLQNLTHIRRAALNRGFRPLGYPTMVFATSEDSFEQVAQASAYMAKYAGIVVLDGDQPWQLLPVLPVRQNIYTDPQKPVQVEPKLYKVGEPDENSPLMFTTNFSLTYFTVQGEVEASRVPSYILAVDTEGTSVLTAYSGDKLTEKTVADAMKKADVENVVKHRKLIIPGYVAVMSGKLEEATGWEVLVGPREASMIPKYLQTVWKP